MSLSFSKIKIKLQGSKVKSQFIYWIGLVFIINSVIAFETPFLHLSNKFAEQDTHRTYVRVTQQDHSSARKYPQLNSYDYAYVHTPDGQKRLKHKADITNYQPQFELGMLNEYVAPSKARQLLGQDYENNSNYFANKFAGSFAENVFHCVLNYQYSGFCKYVQQLPGFDGFVLSMTDQLKAGSELQKRMQRYDGGKEAFAALQRINKAKIKKRDDREYQIKYQAVRQLLQERDFNQLGIGILEHHKITDQFTYHGNMVQIAQLKHIAHFFNDVGTFEQALDQLSELQQIVEHATGFGRLSNQANRSNNISLSQACLEIGRNILALGKGLKNGIERNATGMYHMLRYPVDTAESLGQLVKKIGTGIGKLVTTSIKLDVGMALEDENLIRSAQQYVDKWIDGGRQLYELGKQTWQSKSKLERYELVGNYATDLLLLKGLPAAGKLTAVQKLAEYKPQAFAKIGEVGREINQIVGLTCAKGIEAVEEGLNVLEACPQILKLKDSTVTAIKHCNKKVKIVNQYLENKMNKLISRELETALAGLPEGKNILLNENQLAKALPNIPKALRKALPEPLSGISKEFAIFFDEGQNMITQQDHCKQICQSFLQDSSQFKLPSKCLDHMVEQIIEAESYLGGMSVNEFSYGRFGLAPEVGNQPFRFDYTHHVHPIPELKCRNGRWCAERFKGFHLDYMGTLEEAGEISSEIVEVGPFGAYRANIIPTGFYRAEFNKTMYSKDWRIIDVLKANREAILSPKMKFTIETNGVIDYRGFFRNELEIQSYINKNGTLTTTFPDLSLK